MPNVVNLKDSSVSTYEMRCGQSGTQVLYAKFQPQANFSRVHKPLEMELVLKMLTPALCSFFKAL